MTLHLLPNLLHPEALLSDSLPQCVQEVLTIIEGLIAESPSEGRRFLKKFQTRLPAHQIPIIDMQEDVDFILQPIQEGQQWGLVSDCGLPCVADPGSKIVSRARELGIEVRAYVGPSSVMMSLMLSGLPGQRFSFHGYIAKDPKRRRQELLTWEKLSLKENQTQIFIEAPHRNQHTLKEMLEVLGPETEVVVAKELMSPHERVVRAKVKEWNRNFQLGKSPVIFLFKAP